jgi:ABC-type uncharacterized transport system auxiliary subunit
MKLLKRLIGVASFSFIAVVLGGCGGGRPIAFYTLRMPPPPAPAARVFPISLLVGRIDAPEILQDEPIVYRSGPNEIGTYAYHSWIEPPTKMVKEMLIRRLRDSGEYGSVADLGSEARGNFVLQGRLYDFEEVDTPQVSALVTMEFHLFDRRTRTLVWKSYYSRREPVQGKEISEVVSTLNSDVSQGLSQIVDGLNSYFSTHLGSGQ